MNKMEVWDVRRRLLNKLEMQRRLCALYTDSKAQKLEAAKNFSELWDHAMGCDIDELYDLLSKLNSWKRQQPLAMPSAQDLTGQRSLPA